jgi:hypothetical protein
MKAKSIQLQLLMITLPVDSLEELSTSKLKKLPFYQYCAQNVLLLTLFLQGESKLSRYVLLLLIPLH